MSLQFSTGISSSPSVRGDFWLLGGEMSLQFAVGIWSPGSLEMSWEVVSHAKLAAFNGVGVCDSAREARALGALDFFPVRKVFNIGILFIVI